MTFVCILKAASPLYSNFISISMMLTMSVDVTVQICWTTAL